MPGPKDNGWQAWREEWCRNIVNELDRLNGYCERSEEWKDKLNERLQALAIEIAKLKVKAGVWGLVGGAIPVGIAITVVLIRAMING